MSCIRLLFAIVLLASSWCVRGQTTNILALCTEESLRAAVGIGGIQRLDCSTNSISTIQLTAPLVVERDLTLTSTQTVILDGQSATRLLIVRPGVRLTLQNVYLFSGRQTETNLNDGGIADTAGAAIYNDRGTVTIINGRLQANAVVGVTGRAGNASTGDDGEPGGDAPGAAIYNNFGQLVVSNTVFEANSVIAGPGGNGAAGASGFGGNGGHGGNGGSAAGAAIYSNGGTVFVAGCTFTNNTAVGAQAGTGGAGGGFLGFSGEPGDAGDGVGGAIAGADAEISIYACTFVTNTVKGAAGLAGNAGVLNHEGDQGRNGGDGAGGAAFTTGRLSVTNSTFFANAATGGAGGAGGTAGNQGFGNNGGNGGNGGSGTGGAIETTSPAVVVNCTFSDNGVTGGAGGAAGQATGLGDPGKAGSVGAATGGSIYGRGSEIVLANSILANSKVTIAGNVSDRGGNLSTDLNALLISGLSKRLVNPSILPLANNGGPTATMGLLTNSPAINHGVAEFCPPFDQRGTNRIGICDIGAFELAFAQTNIALPPIPTNVLSSFSIARGTNQILLQWPAGYTNLFLQSTTNLLLTNTAWSTLAPGGTTNGSNIVFPVSTANANRPRAFFRLIGLTNLSLTTITNTNSIPLPPSPGG